MAHVPALPHNCNSWVVRERATGRAVCELFNIENVKRVNTDKYEIFTTLEHLQSLNKDNGNG